jgi:hypothetical protein
MSELLKTLESIDEAYKAIKAIKFIYNTSCVILNDKVIELHGYFKADELRKIAAILDKIEDE